MAKEKSEVKRLKESKRREVDQLIEWLIEEKAKKAAMNEAIRTSLVILIPLSVLGAVTVLLTEVPGLLMSAMLVVVDLTVMLVSYDTKYEKYHKMYLEEMGSSKKEEA
ncbi:MAG: hypothetical protein ACE5J6_00910 [Candidatus Bathyarchaeia archaeon]